MEFSAQVMRLVADAAGDRRDAARRSCAELLAPVAGQAGALTDADRASVLAALAFVDYLDGRFAEAVVGAELAVGVATASGRDAALIIAHSMRMLASAGPVWAGGDAEVDHFEVAWGMRDVLDEVNCETRILVSHFLAEGLLATGRLSEAAQVHERVGDLRALRHPDDEARVPFPAFMIVQRARILLFQGAMVAAQDVIESAIAQARTLGTLECLALAEALLGLVRAHLDDPAGARQSATRTATTALHPRGLLETGAWIVSAYALFAIGDREDAAEFVLTAGGHDELSSLQVIDRSLGYDILIAAALESGDLAAAERWGEHTLPLAAHPAATLVVEQSLSRLDAARGAPLSAADRAQVVAARARLTGRYLDAARADLTQARALVDAGLNDRAIQRLTTVAHDAQSAGVPLLHRAAARQLRSLGRRVPPRPGSGWDSLSEREQQIAVLASEGFSNRVIGSTLFLSERTVQSYISRILIALEVTTRSRLPGLVPGTERVAAELTVVLTPRQEEVAWLVAQGRSNHEVASDLGISVKTAEKHIGEILRRWNLTSRTGIANVVIARSRPRAS